MFLNRRPSAALCAWEIPGWTMIKETRLIRSFFSQSRINRTSHKNIQALVYLIVGCRWTQFPKIMGTVRFEVFGFRVCVQPEYERGIVVHTGEWHPAGFHGPKMLCITEAFGRFSSPLWFPVVWTNSKANSGKFLCQRRYVVRYVRNSKLSRSRVTLEIKPIVEILSMRLYKGLN